MYACDVGSNGKQLFFSFSKVNLREGWRQLTLLSKIKTFQIF